MLWLSTDQDAQFKKSCNTNAMTVSKKKKKEEEEEKKGKKCHLWKHVNHFLLTSIIFNPPMHSELLKKGEDFLLAWLHPHPFLLTFHHLCASVCTRACVV